MADVDTGRPLFDTPELREQDRATADAFVDPQPGMQFHEFYSFWCIVLAVEPDGGKVTTLTLVGPGQVPGIGKVETFDTADDFRSLYAYGSIAGYSVTYLARQTLNVTGWLDHYPAKKWVDKSAVMRERAADAEWRKAQPKKCGACGQVKP